MENSKFPLALFGGSFNPIHNAHLMVLQEILQHKIVKNILLACTYQNPLKENNIYANAEYRLHMVRLATKDLPSITIYDKEVRAKKTSYTIDTVKDIYTMYKDCLQQNKLALIIGSDLLLDMAQWKNVQELSNLVRLIIYPRQIYNCNTIISKLSKKNVLSNNKKQGIKKLYVSLNHVDECCFEYVLLDNVLVRDISATQIRSDIKNVYKYVPFEVAQYIEQEGLYT